MEISVLDLHSFSHSTSYFDQVKMVKRFYICITTSYLVFYTTPQFGTLENKKMKRQEKPFSSLDLAKMKKHFQSTMSLSLPQLWRKYSIYYILKSKS